MRRQRDGDGGADRPRRHEGKRVALPHAKILLNQVSGGFEGEASDIEIQAREVLALGRSLEEIIAEHTGQPLAKVASDLATIT